jgi:hypothetical protein
LDDDVVTGPAVEDVQSRPAEQDIITRAAGENVVAGAADQDIVSVSAVRGKLDCIGGQTRCLDYIVAAQTVDNQSIIRGHRADDVHLRGKTKDGDAGGIPHCLDDIVTRGPLDKDGVCLAVATGGGLQRP